MQQSLFGMLSASPAVSENPADTDQRTMKNKTDLNTPIREACFTVLDLETTGLNAKRNAITEVTAIQYVNGEEVAKYSTLVKPTEAISPEVESFTGITNDMVKDAPAVVMVLSELAGFINESPLVVGHNVSFDLGFLREKLQVNGLAGFLDRFQYPKSFCTKVLAQKALPGLPSYEGVVVATACGYHNPNPHRAESDVRMSAAILFHLINKLSAEKGLKTVGDLLAFQGTLNER